MVCFGGIPAPVALRIQFTITKNRMFNITVITKWVNK